MVESCISWEGAALSQIVAGQYFEEKREHPPFSTLLESAFFVAKANRSLPGIPLPMPHVSKEANDLPGKQSQTMTNPSELERLQNLMKLMTDSVESTKLSQTTRGALIPGLVVPDTKSALLPAPLPVTPASDTSQSASPSVTSENNSPRISLSKGSTGHPGRCASPCKYVKRKGGCMYGDDCPKCHLCFWQRRSSRVKAKVCGQENAAQPDALSLDCVAAFSNKSDPELSIGSLQHPHDCAAPCKYVRRKGGCINGASCPECHLCQWRRKPRKAAPEEADAETARCAAKASGGFSQAEKEKLEGLIRLQLDTASIARPMLPSVEFEQPAPTTRYMEKTTANICQANQFDHLGGDALNLILLRPPPGLEGPPVGACENLLPSRRPGLVIAR